MEKDVKVRLRYKIGEIEFEIEGTADMVDKWSNQFVNAVLPKICEAIKSRSDNFIFRRGV